MVADSNFKERDRTWSILPNTITYYFIGFSVENEL